MMLSLVLSLALASSLPAPTLQSRLLEDASLVVPCVGAERVLLGERGEAVRQRYQGRPLQSTVFDRHRDLFREVLAVGEPGMPEILFDGVLLLEEGAVTCFLSRGRVVALSSRHRDRVTSDMVDLSRGLERCVVMYGNEGMRTLTRDNHKMLIYPRKGLAVVDDHGDDVIDLVVVFGCR